MYRQEHPKPGFERKDWINLNGTWKYAFDFGVSGIDKKWFEDTSAMTCDINVPFCPESDLSGVGYKDFINGIWYTRDLPIPENWKGDKVFIHFGGVDYEAMVYVNGLYVGRHIGQVSFSIDITNYLKESDNKLVVFAKDLKDEEKPRGKQSDRYFGYGCLYTRVTGIWQTVWLERRPCTYIDSVKVTPDFDNSALTFIPVLKNINPGDIFKITVSGHNKTFIKEIKAQNGAPVVVDMPDFIPWSPENPFLYDIKYELISNGKIDEVKSYAGMRKIEIRGNKFYLNNEEIFLRLVLDQGFYPDGIWTAPSDDALINDIKLSLKAGFNGARLHQKVFEERFLYHADKLGYLVWAEHGDWGFMYDNWKAMAAAREEFLEEVVRDYNHPSIIAWTPYNETVFMLKNNNRTEMDINLKATYDAIKAYDPIRPINDASGFLHYITDIYTIHDYEQDYEKLAKRYENIELGKNYETEGVPWSQRVCPYEGQPLVIDEYGGPLWNPKKDNNSWGYSENNDIEEVYSKIEMLTKVLVDNPAISGFCYTQLTDVEQEKNGIYFYDRTEKFDMERIKKYFSYPRKNNSD